MQVTARMTVAWPSPVTTVSVGFTMGKQFASVPWASLAPSARLPGTSRSVRAEALTELWLEICSRLGNSRAGLTSAIRGWGTPPSSGSVLRSAWGRRVRTVSCCSTRTRERRAETSCPWPCLTATWSSWWRTGRGRWGVGGSRGWSWGCGTQSGCWGRAGRSPSLSTLRLLWEWARQRGKLSLWPPTFGSVEGRTVEASKAVSRIWSSTVCLSS